MGLNKRRNIDKYDLSSVLFSWIGTHCTNDKSDWHGCIYGTVWHFKEVNLMNYWEVWTVEK
jgi:hypothetical protein